MARLIDRRQVVGVCGEMTWPAATWEVGDLSWKLRHAPETLSESDHLLLASVVDGYLQLVKGQPKKRNAVCREIVQASRTPLGDGKGRPEASVPPLDALEGD